MEEVPSSKIANADAQTAEEIFSKIEMGDNWKLTLLIVTNIMRHAEEKIYMQSKGKHRCSYMKISDYKVDGIPLSDVFSQFVQQYANNNTLNEIKHDKQATKNLLYITFINLVKGGYQEYLGPVAFEEVSKEAAEDLRTILGLPENDASATEIDKSAQNPNEATANQIINSLMANVVHEISLEASRSPDEFFSIKKGLKPCLNSPQNCTTKIAPLVQESYLKFDRGIIATILLLNDGKFDKQLFDKVREAMIRPVTDPSERIRMANMSPAGREIMRADKLSDDDKTGVFSIWYLRQIPYAGEDIWKTKGYPKRTWNEYLDSANMYLNGY